VGRLPSTSQFVKDQRLDPENAEHALDDQEERDRRGWPQRQWRPDLAEWGPTEEVLATLTDRMGELEALIANLPHAMNGKKGKAKPPKPYPRPKTGIEEAEKRRRVRRFYELDAEVQEAQQRWRDMQAAGSAS
jgi:hypothetical protein